MFDDEDGFLTIEKYHTIRTNKEIADEWKNETKMRFDLQFDKKIRVMKCLRNYNCRLWNNKYLSGLFNQNVNEGTFLIGS